MPAACDAPTKIFKMKCALSGCHDGKTSPPDLSGSNPESMLVGKVGSDCAPMPLISTTKPASGVLFKKLMGTDCSLQMPVGGMLTSDEIKCVTDWANSVIP